MQKRIVNFWLANARWIAFLFTGLVIITSLVSLKSLSIKSVLVSDKVLHISAYIVLMWVWLMVFKQKSIRNRKWLLVVLLTLFGIIIEGLQGYVTLSRTPDLIDVFANFIGLIIGIITFKAFTDRLLKNTI